MAIEATFTGWLNDKKDFDWGTVLKMSHSVRRKDESGQWQTVGKDYIDVIIPAEKSEELRHALAAPVPCRMDVTGNAKPAHYTNAQGEVVSYLKIWANAVEVQEQDFNKVQEVVDTPF